MDQANVKIDGKEGKHYRFMDLEYWSQNGMVRIFDHGDGSLRSVSEEEWRDRGNAIREESKVVFHVDERIRMERTAEEIKKCADEAHRQGSPTDEKTMKYIRTHKSFKNPIFGLVPDLPMHRQSPNGLILPKGA